MAKIIWSPGSIEDIARLYLFVANKNQEAANRIAKALHKEVNLLVQIPNLGRPMDDNSDRRELYMPFGGGRYIISYMLDAESKPVIIRVWRSRELRNPV